MDIEMIKNAADEYEVHKNQTEQALDEMKRLEKVTGEIWTKKFKEKTDEVLFQFKNYFGEHEFTISNGRDALIAAYKKFSFCLSNINYTGDHMYLSEKNHSIMQTEFWVDTKPDDEYYSKENLPTAGRIRLIDCLKSSGKIDYEEFINKLSSTELLDEALESINSNIVFLHKSIEQSPKSELIIREFGSDKILKDFNEFITRLSTTL